MIKVERCHIEDNLTFLLNASVLLNEKSNYKDALEKKLKNLCEFLEAFVGMIILHDRFSNMLMTTIFYSLSTKINMKAVYQLNEWIISRVSVLCKRSYSFLCIPILNKNEVTRILSMIFIKKIKLQIFYEKKFLKLLVSIILGVLIYTLLLLY